MPPKNNNQPKQLVIFLKPILHLHCACAMLLQSIKIQKSILCEIRQQNVFMAKKVANNRQGRLNDLIM